MSNLTSTPVSIDTDIGDWLTSLGFECYIEAFRNQHIDLRTVTDLNDDNFKELGVSVGHRVKLKKAISELLNENVASNTNPSSPTIEDSQHNNNNEDKPIAISPNTSNSSIPTTTSSSPTITSSNSNASTQHPSNGHNNNQNNHSTVNNNHNNNHNNNNSNNNETANGGGEPGVMKEIVYKVIVVGDVGTGKTSLIQRSTSGMFDDRYKATIGVDFCLKEIQWNRDTLVNVQLWDIAGQERFASLTRMYYKQAKGAFVVFDLMREKTFDAVLKWKADIDAKVTLPNGQVIPVVLLANKCDLATQPIDLDQFCKDHGFQKWFKTSAKQNVGLEDAIRFLVQSMMENDDIMTAPSEDTNKINVQQARPTKKSGCCS